MSVLWRFGGSASQVVRVPALSLDHQPKSAIGPIHVEKRVIHDVEPDLQLLLGHGGGGMWWPIETSSSNRSLYVLREATQTDGTSSACWNESIWCMIWRWLELADTGQRSVCSPETCGPCSRNTRRLLNVLHDDFGKVEGGYLWGGYAAVHINGLTVA